MIALLAQPVSGADPLDWEDVLRHDVIPVASAYLVFLGVLLAYRRAGARAGNVTRRTLLFGRRRSPGGTATTADLLRYLLDTAIGGYALFLAIVVTYYLALGGESWEFVRQALVEGSMLTFGIVVPGLFLISLLHEARRRRRGGGRPPRRSGSRGTSPAPPAPTARP